MESTSARNFRSHPNRREGAAAAQVELSAHQRERVAQGAGIREWSEVTRPVVFAQPGEREVRDRVAQVHFEHQEPLVVAEADVVTRVEFLDELAFQQQRLRLAPHDVEIEIVNGIGQRLELQVPAQSP
jgi:hypothetical protein